MDNYFLLPIAASICLLVAMIQAWLMTLVRYFNVKAIRKLFPNYRDLVRSHVDYLMMASLIYAIYLVLIQLQIMLPSLIVWLLFIGAIYNPFGFLLQAIKPDIAESGGMYTRVGTAVGFLPLTIGLLFVSVMIIKSSFG